MTDQIEHEGSWKRHVTKEAIVVSLAISLVGSVAFSIFLEPIAKSSRVFLGGYLGILGTNFLDRAVISAVYGPERAVLSMLHYAVTWAYIGMSIGVAIIAKELLNRIAANLRKIDALDQRLAGNEPTVQDESSDQLLRQDIGALRSSSNRLIKSVKLTWRSTVVISVVVAAAGLWRVAEIQTAFSIRSSYEVRSAALSGVLTDRQMKELNSAWAMCQSHAEYSRLSRRMKDLASENDLALPD